MKAALYTPTATTNASTTAYSATNEVSSAGYTAGGVTVTNGTVALTTNTQYWTPAANFAWTGVSFTTDCVLLYNTSVATNRAIAVYTFSSQTVTAGNFTLTMPTNAAGTALLNLT